MAVTITEGYIFIVDTNTRNSGNLTYSSGDSIDGSEGTHLVKIIVPAKVTHNYNNDIFFSPFPSTAPSSSNPKVLNLNKIKEAITVQGVIRRRDLDGTTNTRAATASYGEGSVVQRKTDLLTIAKAAQPVTIVWGVDANSNQQVHTDFNINKIQLTEVAGKVEEQTTAREQIEVILQGFLGTGMI